MVSGLALGVDGAAHEGALEAGGRWTGWLTGGVVGTGLDRVYPARHRELAHRIAGRGLIVSEYPLGTPPLNQNFPQAQSHHRRLARGTLVVEAALPVRLADHGPASRPSRGGRSSRFRARSTRRSRGAATR